MFENIIRFIDFIQEEALGKIYADSRLPQFPNGQPLHSVAGFFAPVALQTPFAALLHARCGAC